jgi:predicted PurR-regulated permease PerM
MKNSTLAVSVIFLIIITVGGYFIYDYLKNKGNSLIGSIKNNSDSTSGNPAFPENRWMSPKLLAKLDAAANNVGATQTTQVTPATTDSPHHVHEKPIDETGLYEPAYFFGLKKK